MESIILFGLPLVEWIGYVASAIVLVSLSLSSLVKLRIYNLIGAAIFSFYGFYIGALPVGIMNLAICFFDIYYLRTLLFKHEDFDFIEIKQDDDFLLKFLSHFKKDIAHYFPGFSLQTDEEKYILMALRDMNVAGVFIGTKPANGVSDILLDYVTPQYRDQKTGKFLFQKFKEDFLGKSVHALKCASTNTAHIKYLKKNGFEERKEEGCFVLSFL
jgi:ribosomal protein S18 acetylase RimI-like enzyme